jgi:dipeptidase E
MRLLLISNSTGPGGGFLDHCEDELLDFLGRGVRILFVPFAGTDERAYGAAAVDRLNRMGFAASWADRSGEPIAALSTVDAVFVGGGNTFLLLDRLVATGMRNAIRDRVLAGMPYVGASAGSNVAGPTIRTTNDMPIVEPPSFEALGLVPFQINPHYIDRDPDSTHQGETREQRLQEYLTQNEGPVVALREGAMLRVEDDVVRLRGSSGARLYRRGVDVEEVAAGAQLSIRPEVGRDVAQ